MWFNENPISLCLYVKTKKSIGTISNRIEAIQVLRGLAAMLVVLFHAIKLLDHRKDISLGILWSTPCLHDFGAVGVDLFFVISGFAMAEAVSGKRTKRASDFLAERFVRIIPLYWLLSLISAVALAQVLGWNFTSAQIANSMTQLPLWDGLKFEAPVLSVGWTLMFEWAFYLVVAFALICSPARPLRLALGIALAFGLGGMALGPLPALPMLWLNALWLEFAGGVLLQMLWRSGEFEGRQWAGPVMLIAGLLSYASSISANLGFSVDAYDFFRGADNARFLTWGLPSIFLVGGCLLCAERTEVRQRLSRARWWGALRWLGDISYSLYLAHLPLFIIISEKLAFPWRGELLVVAMVFGAVVVAATIHRFVEMPMLRLMRQQLAKDGIKFLPRRGSASFGKKAASWASQ